MDIRTLRYCVALSEELNFTTLAKQSHITQQALSHQIISLERELGYLLFNRNNRSMEVTPAGKVFIDGIRNALMLIDKAIDSGNEYSMGNRGIISLAYTGPFEQSRIINAMRKYNGIHPDILINIRNMFYEKAMEVLDNNVMDLICVTHFSKLTFSEKYATRKIFSGHYKVIISNNHPYANTNVIRKEDLSSESLILLNHKRNDILQSSMLNEIRSLFGELPKKIIYAHDIVSVTTMIEAGIGYTISPSKLENEYNNYHHLAFKEIDAPHKRAYSWFVWLKENNSPYLLDFINLAI